MNWDFVISGGGIGGAVLGSLLARAGKRVLVIEKNLQPPSLIRPEGLWPATVETLKNLLPPEKFQAMLLPVRGIRIFRGRKCLLELGEDAFQDDDLRLRMTDPSQTREALLSAGKFELRRGVEVVGVIKRQDRIAGVQAREVSSGKQSEILADCTVGDDGAHSVIRNGCGIELKTRMFPLELLCFGFDWPNNIPKATPHLFLNEEASRSGIVGLGAVPMPGGKGAALVPVRKKIFNNPARAIKDWQRFTSSDARLNVVLHDRTFPDSMARVVRLWGHAKRYGAPGALLLGDAAHPVSPAGGQGANMAVADAVTIAQLVLSGVPNVVEEYERHRRAANERSVSMTRKAAAGLALPDWIVMPLIPFALAWMGKHPDSFEDLLRGASHSFRE